MGAGPKGPRVLRVLRVQRVWYRPSGDEFYMPLRGGGGRLLNDEGRLL